ncbi:hypothetical protein WG906_07055 [Pedobacter sp. P351]|uniref:hypothetical protein n=1 Tax=Pedobacter superstes TaxID=3133441 RepID=UPI003095F6B7
METSYLPVQWVYREIVEEEIAKETNGTIFYFNDEDVIRDSKGRIVKLEDISGEGVFIKLDSGESIRIDRVITLYGKPGAAYEDYNYYANACLDCMGGYQKGELE